MRRSKRIKVMKKQEEIEEEKKTKGFDLKDFRLDVIGSIPIAKLRIFDSEKQKQKGYVPFDYNNPWATKARRKKMQNKYKFGYFYWESLGIEERLEEVLSRTEGLKLDANHKVHEGINGIRLDSIKSIYERHTGKRFNLSKKAGTWELFLRFYEKESMVEKREKEKKNVKEFDIEKDLDNIYLNGIMMPNEMVQHIISYIPKNIKTLEKIGGACKNFYIQMLTNWGGITITRKNIYFYSILVLKNCTSLKIEGIIQKEQDYLWSHVDPFRIKNIEICGDDKYIRSVLSNMEKKKKKDETMFSKVKELKFNPYPKHFFYAQVHPLQGSVARIFPSLDKVRGVATLFQIEAIENCGSLFTLELIFGEKNSLFSFMMQKLEPESIKTLIIRNIDPSYDFVYRTEVTLPEIILFFPNLKELKLGFKCDCRDLIPFDMSIFDLRGFNNNNNNIQVLDRLSIVQNYRGTLYKRKDFPIVVFPKSDLNIKEINLLPLMNRYKIKPNNKKGVDYTTVEFTLSELMKQSFFEVCEESLKIFRCDMSIASKKLKGSDFKGMDELGERFVEFIEFLEKSLRNYEIFSAKFRVHDRVFKIEKFHFIYERKFKRLRVSYNSAMDWIVNDEDHVGVINSEGNKHVGTDIVDTMRPCTILMKMFFGQVIRKLVSDHVIETLVLRLDEYLGAWIQVLNSIFSGLGFEVLEDVDLEELEYGEVAFSRRG